MNLRRPEPRQLLAAARPLGLALQVDRHDETYLTELHRFRATLDARSRELRSSLEMNGRRMTFGDLIAVDGDPLANVADLEKITFVMKSGVVIRDAARARSAGPS